MSSLMCIGELLIDFVSNRVDASLAEAPEFVKAPGGAPANVAVAAVRMGLASAFIGKVGPDPFGDFLDRTLEDAGVSTRHLFRSDEARTTLAFVATRSDGRKEIAFYRHPGADMLLSPDELPLEDLRRCRCVHFGSVSLTREPARSATLTAVRTARDAGAFISFDPNLRPPLWEDLDEARELIWQGMALADLAKVAEEEWEFITGTTDLEAGARKILDYGPRLCLTTLGPNGAYYDDGARRGSLPGFDVNVVDTLGAGDAFAGAVLSELLKAGPIASLPEAEIRRIVRWGNAAGALTCTGAGVIPCLPTREQVATFLESASHRP